ncbi:MAG: hypothetical protein HXX20_22400 [Chloroflexi bacterium]|nr:hypothetical protein [Chloroflexota bacterium]
MIGGKSADPGEGKSADGAALQQNQTNGKIGGAALQRDQTNGKIGWRSSTPTNRG